MDYDVKRGHLRALPVQKCSRHCISAPRGMRICSKDGSKISWNNKIIAANSESRLAAGNKPPKKRRIIHYLRGGTFLAINN